MLFRSSLAPPALTASTASTSSVALAPRAGPLNIRRVTWPAGEAIHRIHLNVYAADGFNPGLKGNARFSPIRSAAGVPIPTLYGGTTFECAAMETVFHDVPFAPGIKQHDKAKLAGQAYSQLTPQFDLKLVDLSVVALRHLGVQRDRLIDTESSEYPITRLWAQAFHTQFPDIQGLWWVSRQDDRARAIVLFGDRIKPNDLVQTAVSRDVLADDDVYTELLQLANTIGVRLVAGKASGP